VIDNKEVKLVTWLDITSQTEPWIDLTEAQDMKPATMVTLGWIVKETSAFVTLASTHDLDEDLVGDVNCIPRPAIISIVHLDTEDSIVED